MSVRSPIDLHGLAWFGFASALLCGALSDLSASDHNWPHLRGPNYNSHSDETELLESWPADGPPVLWVQDLGQGYSGFCCVENRIYTQMQTVTGQYVVCLDADTGETLWEHRYGLPYEALGIYPGPRSTPTWSNGRLYFAGPMGLIRCLNAQDGKPIWSVNVKEKYDGKGTGFGYASCPLIDSGMVILPVGGKGASIVALDADDGSTVWKSGDAHSSYCSALPITFENERLVITFLENSFACLELKTGRMLWTKTYSQGYDEHAAMPLYEEPNLVLSFPFKGGSTMYRLERKESATGDDDAWTIVGKEVWHSRKLSNDVASRVLVDGHIYGFDLRDAQSRANRPSRGQFKCLDLETGEVLWASDATGHSSVIAADGKLILFNDRGEVILIRARPDRYEELA